MPALQLQLLRYGALGMLLLVASAALLTRVAVAASVVQWLLQSALLWAFVWWQSWRCRHLNHAGDSALYPELGFANGLTLLRGGLIAATGGFLFQAAFVGFALWLPALLYSVAAILDRADGYVARRSRRLTLMGTELDTRYDALGLLVAPMLAVVYAKIHWSYLLVSAAYYVFQLGQYWRQRHGLAVYPLYPSLLRRTLAGFQMGLIAVVLWPPFQSELTRIVGVAFMVPVLVGFGVDWLVVSGRIDPAKPATAAAFARMTRIAHALLLPALRLLLVLLVLWLAFREANAWPRMAGSALAEPVGLSAWGLLLGAVLVGSGLAARSGALLLLLLLASHLPVSTFVFATYLLIFCAVWIMLLGSGRFSVWQGDAEWINRHDG